MCLQLAVYAIHRERPDQEMIPELEVMPEDIAEVALLPFKLSKNVVLEEITVQTGAASHPRQSCSAAAASMRVHLRYAVCHWTTCTLYLCFCLITVCWKCDLQARRPRSQRSSGRPAERSTAHSQQLGGWWHAGVVMVVVSHAASGLLRDDRIELDTSNEGFE
jgi:hypothetical protein